jgi:LPS sulfotransferase NodH
MSFRSYFLCATPRSGSTLLCDLLTATSVGGRPASYFREQDLADWSKRLGVAPGEPEISSAYLGAVLDHGSAGTGVCGCRIMWGSLGGLLSRLDVLYPRLPGDVGRIERAFGPTLYVHLTRADKVAQAVSLLKAGQSGLWHRHSDGTWREGLDRPRPTSYVATLIAQHVDELKRDDESWTSWFAENGITPVTIGYDGLVADPRSAVAGILSALGLDSSLAADVKPRTARLADDESLDWARRFRRDGVR